MSARYLSSISLSLVSLCCSCTRLNGWAGVVRRRRLSSGVTSASSARPSRPTRLVSKAPRSLRSCISAFHCYHCLLTGGVSALERRVQPEADVEEPERHHSKHSRRHRLPRADHLQERASSRARYLPSLPRHFFSIGCDILTHASSLSTGWTKPIIIGRHAHGDQVRASVSSSRRCTASLRLSVEVRLCVL
jgi:hypothetical protein